MREEVAPARAPVKAVAQPVRRHSSHRGGRLAALDGLRGVAVAAVVLYHMQIQPFRGGLLGVDLFFVLSGYLITGLILREWRETGALSLKNFWVRRARRLLPALFITLPLVAIIWHFLYRGAELATVRDDVVSTLFYFANWHSIFAGHSYFTAFAAPSPLLHTWSLAVEEQFYLFWPLIAVVALVRYRSIRMFTWIAVVGTIASAMLMVILSFAGADPSRLYFGTDTRAQTILVGAVLAILLHGAGRDVTGETFGHRAVPAHRMRRRVDELPPHGRTVVAGAGFGGAVFVLAAMLRPEGTGSWLYRGGLTVLGVAAVAVIASVVLVPGGMLARVLSVRPLRVLGRISYGLYLYHWPIIVALDESRTGLSGWKLDALRLALMLVLAVLSLVLVEQPIREKLWRIPRPAVVVPAFTACLAVLVIVAPIPKGNSTLEALAHAGPPPPPPAAPASLHHDPPPTTAAGVSGSPAVTVPAVSHSGPVRVMLEGDSVGWSLGVGIGANAQSAGITFANEGYIGCGIAFGGETSFPGYTQPAACATWDTRWKSQVDTYQPDVTLVLLGRWELIDRVHDGAWMHIGVAEFDSYLTAELETVVKVLTSDGGRVAFLTSLCNDRTLAQAANPGRVAADDDARVKMFNEMLAQIVHRHPGVTKLVPFDDMVCPGGHYVQSTDQGTLRTSDGVHMEPLAGKMFDAQLMPQTLAWLQAPQSG